MKTAIALLFVIGLVLAMCPSVFSQDVIYVVDTGDDTNPGTSWGLPVKHINVGIGKAQARNYHQVWVKKGSYTECVQISNYYIWLYGGFEGGETSPDQRSPGNKSTIAGKNSDSNPFENCPCVTIDTASNSRVDGFVLTQGGGTSGARYGGGIYCVASDNVYIWNNTITDNHANHGAGLYIQNCDNTWVSNNTVESNVASVEGGGLFAVSSNFGIQYAPSTAPKLESNTFTDNLGGDRGGGILMDNNCSGWIWNNTIGPVNRAVEGAGIALYANSVPTIEDNTINANEAGETGGGIYCNQSGSHILFNVIESNIVGNQGGGIAVTTCSPHIERNRIKSNSGQADGSIGGGIYAGACSSIIAGNIIDGNTVHESGGGIYETNGSNLTITSNTIALNDAILYLGTDCTGLGGGLFLCSTSSATLRNNILYNNWASHCTEIYCETGSSVDSDYNDYFNNRVETCGGNNQDCGWVMGTNDLGSDPEFVDGDYHLGPRSQVIDKGTNSASGMPGKDYPDGESRILDGDGLGEAVVDMGADEVWQAVITMNDAKGAEEGRPVELNGPYVTSVFDGYFYVEDPDRYIGIRVDKESYSLSITDPAYIYGRIRTNSGGERYIDAIVANDIGDGELLKPLGVTNRALGGGRYPATGSNYQQGVYSWNNSRKEPPWACAKGLSNIGLLVKVWGKVTCINRDTANPENEYFYIDDGSMRVDGSMFPGPITPNIGVRVVLPGTSLPLYLLEDSYVTVTGISSCTKFDSDPVRLLRLRSEGDLQIIQMPEQ